MNSISGHMLPVTKHCLDVVVVPMISATTDILESVCMYCALISILYYIYKYKYYIYKYKYIYSILSILYIYCVYCYVYILY